jgi:hypothetical protein
MTRAPQIDKAGPIRRGPPVSIVFVGVVANITQLVQLLALPLHPVALVGLGFTVLGGILLAAGRSFGWILMMFWAASVVSAPLVFDAPLWPVLGGALVVGALITQSARGYCFGRLPGSGVSIHPVAAERELTGRLRDSLFRFEEAVAPFRIRRALENHVPRSWLRRRNVFLFFLVATFVLLPLSGIFGRLDRNSGHGDLLVDVAYHVVSVSSTLALLGLIVTIFLILRTMVVR